MASDVTLDELWASTPSNEDTFDPDRLAGLPAAARRYLEHAIAPGTLLASAVRLRMHGRIKLQRWFPFRAEQVIRWDRGMIWRATVRTYGLPISGSDRFLDGEGALRWKLLGLLPVVTASGPDVARSAAGRVHAEAIWLPSVLCREDVAWQEHDARHVRAHVSMHGYATDLDLTVDDRGRLEAIRMQRWGNPDGGAFHDADFGGAVEEEATFGGYTIPRRVYIGWYFGSPRFEPEGAFFRATIDEARFR